MIGRLIASTTAAMAINTLRGSGPGRSNGTMPSVGALGAASTLASGFTSASLSSRSFRLACAMSARGSTTKVAPPSRIETLVLRVIRPALLDGHLFVAAFLRPALFVGQSRALLGAQPHEDLEHDSCDRK